MRRGNRNAYAAAALDQIPRLLGNTDRNAFSKTYGCMHRDYWLDKTSDFPDAVRQFGVHALAQVYAHGMPGNIYYRNPRVRDWSIAALDYWSRIQHGDGSFDEFYPFERGWVGPTAFTTFTSVESLQLLRAGMTTEVRDRVAGSVRKAAHFIAAGESEEDHLANHHAMACLAIWKSYKLLGDEALRRGFERAFEVFKTYHRPEGWSREYDGVDPGYLSATVSFLAKVYVENPAPEIGKVLDESVEFASYFVYPNGFYAGSLGSRNTLHFYPHGFELLASRNPLAAAVADRMLVALEEGKLVPPAIMADRYAGYRVPEFLQAYVDFGETHNSVAELPYERAPYRKYFPGARIFAAVEGDSYVIANLAKGGVTKVFNRRSGELLLNDCGILAQLSDGRVATSQWIDPGFDAKVGEDEWSVRGSLHLLPGQKLFTPFKGLIFRAFLLLIGWNPTLAHWLKGFIRRVLILGAKDVEARFERTVRIKDGSVSVCDTLVSDKADFFESVSVGGEFFIRYVPQSRYFQSQELELTPERFDEEALQRLNKCEPHTIERTCKLS